MIECFQKRDNDIADDREGDENIECTADTVALVADLDDVKYFFFHSGYFYNNFGVNVFPCWYKRGGVSQSRRLPPLQVVSNSKFVSVGVGSPTEINAPRGCAVILIGICQLR